MNERMAQFVVAGLMIAAALAVFLVAIDNGTTAATVGGTVVAAILGLGAIVLAQDRKPS